MFFESCAKDTIDIDGKCYATSGNLFHQLYTGYQEFISLNDIVVGFVAGTDKFIILYLGFLLAFRTKNLNRQNLDLKLTFAVFLPFGRDYCFEGILHEDGLDIGKQAYPHMDASDFSSLRFGID
jgi:hypothetical protein